MSYDEHLISMAGGDGELDLGAIKAAESAIMTAMLERPGSDGYVDGYREYARAALAAAHRHPCGDYRSGGEQMSDMAEVMLEHRVMRTGHCSCGQFLASTEPERIARHVAEALAAAGFGLVREVTDRVGKRYAALHQKLRDELRAQAWEEGFQDGHRQDAEGDDGPRFTNPYRSAR